MSKLFEPIKTAEIIWREGLPYSVVFDDIYFSTESGLDETKHVFIEGNRLIERWQALSAESNFIIAETGFGSGLNFLLTWSLWKKFAPASAKLYFISCEKYPLSREDLATCFTLWPQLQEESSQLLAHYPILTPGFHSLSFDEGRINLMLMLGDALSCYRELLVCGDISLEQHLREYYIDAWFLDGFSPVKNPVMWDTQLFAVMAMLSKDTTTLTTFSAARIVKDGLIAAGFKVHKKRGYGQKRDMVFAEYDKTSFQPRQRYTPWHVALPRKNENKRALIIGAGLAGCYVAHALARRGWKVTILDAKDKVALGASGNRQAILYPKLSAFYSPLNAFMWSAYLFAIREYKTLLKQHHFGELSGMLQLAYDQKECVIQENLRAWLSHYPEIGTLVNAKEASAIAGIAVQSDGLFLPHSGWLDSPALCEFLIQKPGIQWIGDTTVTSLTYEDGVWYAGSHAADIVVLANGYQANTFAQTTHLPLKAIHGQMTLMASNEYSQTLRVPVCADGHIIPVQEGVHGLGATFHLGLAENSCFAEDDIQNLEKLHSLAADFKWSKQIVGQWAGIRTAAPDYLPLVGPVANAVSFKRQMSGLASDSKRWVPSPGEYYDGLYICAGFGSRGLTTVPLSAEWLAAMINKEPSYLPRTMMQALSPARFLRRDIIGKNKR